MVLVVSDKQASIPEMERCRHPRGSRGPGFNGAPATMIDVDSLQWGPEVDGRERLASVGPRSIDRGNAVDSRLHGNDGLPRFNT